MLTLGKSQANQDKLASSVSFGTILTVTPVILHSHPPKLPPKARKKPGPSGILSKGGEAPLGCSSRHPHPHSPRGLRAGRNGHEDGLARKVTSEQVLVSAKKRTSCPDLLLFHGPPSARTWEGLGPAASLVLGVPFRGEGGGA